MIKEIDFYSWERQDEYAYNLIGEKGIFLDLGCSNPTFGSNTYGLEKLGWSGLCFDIRDCQSEYDWTSIRSQKFVQTDVTSEYFLNYISNFKQSTPVVDYVSLDMDTAGQNFALLGLKNIIKSGLKFKALTFEHEYHYHGPENKMEGKRLLESAGYHCLFDDVSLVQEAIPPSKYPGKFFEDWYINPSFFDKSILDISLSKKDYNSCMDVLKQYSNRNYVAKHNNCKGLVK